MAKNIILCSDGTRNKGGVGHPTNVWKLFNSIDLQSYKHSDAVEQVAFYDDGVGTDRLKFLKIIGGAFGWGLTRNVKELYIHLVKNFEAGDHIYLFGFSRGAFTIRTLAGLIHSCGLIDKQHFLINGEAELQGMVDQAFESYRKQGYQDKFFDHLRSLWRLVWALIKRLPAPKAPIEADLFKKTYGVVCEPKLYRDVYQNLKFDDDRLKSRKVVPIRFIGVWDTVDAVGLPLKELADCWNAKVYHFKFPDKELGPAVNKACHVLSIDDERKTFHPTIFDESDEKEISANSDGARIEQVWFPGVHSNVGGGYPKQGLASVSLDWMVGKARQHGLAFELCALKAIRCERNIHDKLYDSRSGLGFFYRYAPRDLAEINTAKLKKVRIHVGAFQRIARHTAGYAPFNLPTKDIEIVPDFPLYGDMPNRGEDSETLKEQARCLEVKFSGIKLKKTFKVVKQVKVKQRKICYGLVICSGLFMLGLGIGYNLWLFITESPIVQPDVAWIRSLENSLESFLGAIPLLGGLLFKGVVQPLLAMPILTFLCLLIMFLAYLADSIIKKQMNDLMCGFWGQALKGPWWRSEEAAPAEENLQNEEQQEVASLYRIVR